MYQNYIFTSEKLLKFIHDSGVHGVSSDTKFPNIHINVFIVVEKLVEIGRYSVEYKAFKCGPKPVDNEIEYDT